MRLPAGGTPSRDAMIVDTDMSSDDIMALTYLLERSDVSVRAITVEGTGVADGRSALRMSFCSSAGSAYAVTSPWRSGSIGRLPAARPFLAPGARLPTACTG
jgi:hypothetical protein